MSYFPLNNAFEFVCLRVISLYTVFLMNCLIVVKQTQPDFITILTKPSFVFHLIKNPLLYCHINNQFTQISEYIYIVYIFIIYRIVCFV